MSRDPDQAELFPELFEPRWPSRVIPGAVPPSRVCACGRRWSFGWAESGWWFQIFRSALFEEPDIDYGLVLPNSPIGQVPPPTGGGRGGGEPSSTPLRSSWQQPFARLPGEAAAGVPAPE